MKNITKQFNKIYEDHHNPDKTEERRMKKVREERGKLKKKDIGFNVKKD